jgi:hypothetical protein
LTCLRVERNAESRIGVILGLEHRLAGAQCEFIRVEPFEKSLTPGFSFRLTGGSGVIMMARRSVRNMAKSRIKALLRLEHRLVAACRGIK